MSTTIARLYNWVTDKTNSVKITASRVDGEMDQVITALNQKVLCKTSAPSSPISGQSWVDTSVTPPLLKTYNGSTWDVVGHATGANIASASAVTFGVDGDSVTITGTTTITSFATLPAGIFRIVTFSGALTLTHNATSLILPGSANITTAAGDCAIFLSLGSGNWKCTHYQKLSGTAVVSSSALRGYMYGLICSNNGTDATNDIDIAAGTATDDTNVYSITLAAFTKRGDAAFSAGTNNGGGNITGSAGIRYIYLIGKTTDSSAADVFFSATAPGSVSLPSGWDIKRLINVIYWAGSAWDVFKCTGQGCSKRIEDGNYNAILSSGSQTSFTDVDCSAFVPDGYTEKVGIGFVQDSGSGTSGVFARLNGSSVAKGNATTVTGAADSIMGGYFEIALDSSGIFEYAISARNVNMYIRNYTLQL